MPALFSDVQCSETLRLPPSSGAAEFVESLVLQQRQPAPVAVARKWVLVLAAVADCFRGTCADIATDSANSERVHLP